ncbi:MAG: hypothetical protein LKK19_01875 [Bacteroidales bacterium]|jgi:hypothetical protein|nr:hypothetical protein [Bacteroidales bacterium]MCI2145859.1 hypothetical protein [Bacteroidales bacterium]
MKWYDKVLIFLLAFIIGALAGLLVRKPANRTETSQIPIITHTEVITQWQKTPSPVALRERKTGRIDTIYLRKDSLIYIHNMDTVGVPLERTQKYYKDSLYRAWISGVNPQLDSIDIASRTVNNYVPVPTYSIVHIGPYAGYGYDPVRKQGAFTIGGCIMIDLREIWTELKKK